MNAGERCVPASAARLSSAGSHARHRDRPRRGSRAGRPVRLERGRLRRERRAGIVGDEDRAPDLAVEEVDRPERDVGRGDAADGAGHSGDVRRQLGDDSAARAARSVPDASSVTAGRRHAATRVEHRVAGRGGGKRRRLEAEAVLQLRRERERAEHRRAVVDRGRGDRVGRDRRRRADAPRRRPAAGSLRVAVAWSPCALATTVPSRRLKATSAVDGMEPARGREAALRVPHGVDRGAVAREHGPAAQPRVRDPRVVELLVEPLAVARPDERDGACAGAVEHRERRPIAGAGQADRPGEQALELGPLRAGTRAHARARPSGRPSIRRYVPAGATSAADVAGLLPPHDAASTAVAARATASASLTPRSRGGPSATRAARRAASRRAPRRPPP